jgi:WD40 repeat protein
LAVVIGINEYQDYPKLQTARYDAERLAEILAIDHKYDYVILAADDTYKEYLKGQELPVKNKYQPTLNGLLNLLSKRLPAEIKPTQEDRLVFYFAGHGIPDDSDEGPKGYLVPLDGDSKKRDSLLPMQQLYKSLEVLNCRHFIVILDCCFAGRFRYWSTTRKGRTFPRVIHKEHYDRFINSPAWQAITSASHDQEAFDILCDNRGTVEGTNHSPFAEGLFKALRGEADVIPAGKNGKPAGDGVITATELYLYLRDHVEIGSKERQTPGLWSLPKHDHGEFIFLVPGVNSQLKPAPKVNEKNNPYRGLESFEEEYAQFFFGRKELIEQLYAQVSGSNQQSSQLTVVLGVSGSGKSSLVKAGLIPLLRKEHTTQWQILKPMRPGESPFTALARTLLELTEITVSNQLDTLNFITEVLKEKIDDLDARLAESLVANGEESSETLRFKKEVENVISIAKDWNQGNQKARQLLIVEHFEELYALCRNLEEQQQLKQVVSDCLNPLSQRLQEPNQFIDIVRAWSQKNPGVKLLLAIDQFEELITLSRNIQEGKQNNQQQQGKTVTKQPTQEGQQQTPEWQQFLSLLENTLNANLEQLRIVVTLRSDFEPRFLNSDALKSYWTKARFPVRAMRSDELRQAIEGPASEMALYFEPPNLVDKLIDEVGQMPGALPLLSFTLSELYIKLAQKWRIQETSDRALRIDADFDTEGGVAGSLTRRANQEYDGLPDDAHRATLRRVMLRMVTTEGGESARRRVPLSEFVYAEKAENDRVKLVLEQFNHARLIVSGQETGEPYVEPAHDFLVRSWDKLQKWQQEEQEDLPLQRRLTPVALEWKSKEHSSSLLGKTEPFLDWCDKKIDSAEDWLNQIKKDAQERRREKKRQFLWNGNPYLDVLRKRLKSYDHWFNEVETEFVQQSVWQRRRNTNLRWGIAIGVILLSSGLTIIALIGQRNAQIGQIDASRQASEAYLLSNQEFDALIASVQAAEKLQHSPLLRLFQPDLQLQNQIRLTSQKAFERVKERNRIKILIDTDKVVFSPNGQLIAIVQVDGTVSLWDRTGKQMPEFKPFNVGGQVWSISFSSDSQQLITVSTDEVVKWWNLNGQQLGKDLKQPGSVNQVMLGSNGRLLIFSDNKLRDLESGTQLAEFPDKGIGYDKFSPDGKLIATGTAGDTLTIRNVVSKQKLAALKGSFFNSNTPISVSFSPDSKLIATGGSKDDTVYLWDINGNQLAAFKANQGGIKDISFSPDGKQLATVGIDGTLRIWQDLEGKQLTKLRDYQDRNRDVTTIGISPNSQLLVTSDSQGILNLFDLNSEQKLEFLQKFTDISEIHFSSDSNLLAISESKGTIHLLDLENKQQLATFQGNDIDYSQGTYTRDNYGRFLQGLSFSKDGNWLAIGGNNTITVRSRNGQQFVTFDEGPAREKGNIVPNWVQATAFDPSGNLLATGGIPGDVRLWNWKERKQILPNPIKANTTQTRSVVFSPKGNLIATAGLDGSTSGVRLWNLSGEKLAEFIGHQKVVKQVIFSPDGTLIATADIDKVRLWNLSGQQLGEFKGHYPIQSIAFSSDSKTLLTAGLTNNGTWRTELWQIEDLNELLVRNCDWIRDYLRNNPGVTPDDRHLCDGIPPSTPSVQTTTANSPSIVQPSAQKAPSPDFSSNNGQDTPSSSAPANAPARPQNVPYPTPASNNGQNNYRQAPRDRNQASKLNSTSVDAYINQGLTYHRQRNYQQAISSYSKAIALNPNSAKAYSNRAVAYIGQKDYPKAIADSSKTISLKPTDVNAYINRGLAYYHQGNYQQAIANYNKAIELAPSNANAYTNRALAYTRLGNQKAAQVDKRKAAALSQRQLR